MNSIRVFDSFPIISREISGPFRRKESFIDLNKNGTIDDLVDGRTKRVTEPMVNLAKLREVAIGKGSFFVTADMAKEHFAPGLSSVESFGNSTMVSGAKVQDFPALDEAIRKGESASSKRPEEEVAGPVQWALDVRSDQILIMQALSGVEEGGSRVESAAFATTQSEVANSFRNDDVNVNSYFAEQNDYRSKMRGFLDKAIGKGGEVAARIAANWEVTGSLSSEDQKTIGRILDGTNKVKAPVLLQVGTIRATGTLLMEDLKDLKSASLASNIEVGQEDAVKVIDKWMKEGSIEDKEFEILQKFDDANRIERMGLQTKADRALKRGSMKEFEAARALSTKAYKVNEPMKHILKKFREAGLPDNYDPVTGKYTEEWVWLRQDG